MVFELMSPYESEHGHSQLMTWHDCNAQIDRAHVVLLTRVVRLS
jgi:hypothetical protein